MQPVKPPTLIFTGGHHTSALAVAVALRQKGWNIIWLGHKRSLWRDRSDSAEFKEVAAAGIQFVDLKAGKIYHTYHPLKLLRLPLGFIQAFFILLRLRWRLKSELKGIVTFGSYLGVPVVFCGWLLGLPAVSHEQTMSTGWANKFISVFARKIAISWPDSAIHYPKSKVVLTGLPLRPEIVRAKRITTQKDMVKNQIYVTGGKQGSHVINSALLSALNDLLFNYTLIHQTGSSTVYQDYQKAMERRKSLPADLRSRYQIFEYLEPEKAARALATSEVVVARSGAHIVHELAFFGTRCVLIPIPWSSHNEQYQNARFLASHHQAVILPQQKLDRSSLISSVSRAKALRPEHLPIPENGLENVVKLIEEEWGSI